MSSNRLIRVVLAGALLAGLSAAAASAYYPWDKRTHFTFSGPVAVPGVTLPAGTYLFRLADTTSRNVIQVLSENGQTQYAMFFGIPASRSDIPTATELRFMETAAGQPAAIESWWYPGFRTGFEFLYSDEQLRALRTPLRQPVAPVEEFIETEAPAVMEPVEEPIEYLAEPAPMEVQVEEPAPELPATASPLPLAALGGALLLLGAGGVRVWRRARG